MKKFTDYKIKINPASMGDMEMEYLTPEEQEARWERHRELLEENPESYELNISIENDYLLNKPTNRPYTSSEIVIWDANETQEDEK